MLQAVIFDMDGLLVDSEPLWKEIEMKVLGDLGVPLTKEMCEQTTGLRIDEAIRHWYHDYPWQGKSLADIHKEIIEAMIDAIKREAQPMPGVDYILQFFAERNFAIALASSSPYCIIEAVLAKFAIRENFSVVYSAEEEQYGKPHPGVYINTAAKLGVDCRYCLAFEDSRYGLLAAKAARMKAVAVPDTISWGHSHFAIADLKLRSLAEFTDENLRQMMP